MKSSNETEQTKEEYEAELAKVKEITRQLKKSLKQHSKSKLIEIIIAYASDLQELQQMAQLLLEDNKQMEARLLKYEGDTEC